MNIGHSIEDVVENLCRKSFLADFTIRSPKYRKINGQEKEAADVLVVFNETLIAIQIKSKTLENGEPSRIVLDRVKRTLEAASRQFRALFEASSCSNVKSFVNGHGIEVPFDRNQIKNFVLITVFAPVWNDKTDSAEIRFDNTWWPVGGMAAHLFTLAQFTTLLTLLDTISDFLRYLDARCILHSEKVIPEDSDPLDEWALITFEPKRLIEIIQERCVTDISELLTRHKHSTEQLERREKPSYLVDRLIAQLHAAIGETVEVDSRFKLLSEPNSVNSYTLAVRHLAKLNRSERGKLAVFLINRVMKCGPPGISFRGFKFGENSDEAYVVMASTSDRKMRTIELSNIARVMGYRLNAKMVIGLAVGHDWPDASACEVVVADVSKMKHDEALISFANYGLGKMRVAEM